MKKAISMLVIAMLAVSVLLAGGSKDSDNPYAGTLTLTTYDNNLNDFIEKNDLIGKFQKVYPDADIEVEKIKDDTEYWNAMKMRASAGQLPDIMFNKPFTLARFQDYMLDLSDTKAAADSLYAADYAVNGRILGIPLTSGYEYVYYWKDLFQEAGVEVPETWEELQEVCSALQAYYGAKDPDFMALGLGLKDEHTDYPFMEFMPALISGNGQNWNTMASQDRPFDEGTDVRACYELVYKLFNSGILGKDPLGVGNDQVTNLFAVKRVAVFPSGDWSLMNIINAGADITELGTFYLPARQSEDDPFRVIVQADSFMGVSKHSKHPELAKAFIEWFYSEAWYPDYINYVAAASSMKTFPKEKSAVLAEADQRAPDAVFVVYDGGGEDFIALQNETAFDYKKLGAQMVTPGFDLAGALETLNSKWTAARAKLGIK